MDQPAAPAQTPMTPSSPKKGFRTFLWILGIAGVLGFLLAIVVRAIAGEDIQTGYEVTLALCFYATALGFGPLLGRWMFLFIVNTLAKASGGQLQMFPSLYTNREKIAQRIQTVVFVVFLIGILLALPFQLANL